MSGTSGNLSILISEPAEEIKFLITASRKDKGELTEDDFVLQMPCQCIPDVLPSAETPIHAAIYKHTDAKAVFHVHTTNSTLLSQIVDHKPQALSFKDLEMLKGLGCKTHDVKITIPVIENSQDMDYLSSVIPDYINEKVPGFLLKGHGIYAWGKSVSEAKRHVEIFEFLFEYKIKELQIENLKTNYYWEI